LRSIPPLRRSRFYYGWICVGVSALAMVATLPGRTMGLGVITEPLLRDLRLSRTDFAAVNLWATLLGAGFGLGGGRLLDRFGARAVLTAVSLALGGVVLGMSWVTGLGWLFVAVTLTRGLGQSALSTASIAVIGKWFHRRVDQAMAVYAVLLTIGFMVAIPALEAGVRGAGWRLAWGSMGLALLLGMAPLAWALTRDSPEAEGVAVDGGPPDAAPVDPVGFTLGHALSTPAFWAFALGGLVFNTAYSGITLFNESILVEHGYTGTPTNPLIVMVFTGLAANFLAGWLAGRLPITRIMAGGMLQLAAALLALPLVRTPDQVMAYAAALGVAGGVVTVVFFACWSRVFGRRHVGRIQGAAQAVTVLASAAGPLLFAEAQARTGRYDAVFFALAPLAAALALFCWFVRLPALPGPPS
jgi:MFS family permease